MPSYVNFANNYSTVGSSNRTVAFTPGTGVNYVLAFLSGGYSTASACTYDSGAMTLVAEAASKLSIWEYKNPPAGAKNVIGYTDGGVAQEICVIGVAGAVPASPYAHDVIALEVNDPGSNMAITASDAGNGELSLCAISYRALSATLTASDAPYTSDAGQTCIVHDVAGTPHADDYNFVLSYKTTPGDNSFGWSALSNPANGAYTDLAAFTIKIGRGGGVIWWT